MNWPDGKPRCHWANPNNKRYLRYHDEEWGVPVFEDQKLFEMLLLESFQAGLSWECILNKREGFREAFNHFDFDRIRLYGEDDLIRLQNDSRIVRHKAKIQAAVINACVFYKIREEYGSFANYLWGWTGGKTLREIGCSRSPLSDQISADLKRRGMKFVGSVTIYSYLQAVGIINSHESCCFLLPC